MTAVDERDEWMKRTGPFFPLLVAFRMHSRLPVAADLDPTEDDVRRAVPWTLAVGFAVGGALSLVAWLLLRTPLVPAIVATLLVAMGVFVSGAFAEYGLAGVLARRIGAGSSIGSGHLLAAVLLRIGLFLGTAPEAWVAALVLSLVAGRLGYLLLLRPPWVVWMGAASDASESDDPAASGLSTSSWAVLATVVVLGAIAFAGARSLLIVLGCVAVAALARRARHRLDAEVVVAVCELLALVVLAASSPAVVSPLIARP